MKITKTPALVFTALMLVVWPTCTALAEKLDTVVETQNGFVLGTEETKDGYETWSWKGIPFAQPPERWKAPQPPANWGALIANTFGSMCPQYAGQTFIGSEDCLYLNVWRPRTQERNLPVYFWIHGGGNSAGSGSDPWYHGNKLAPRANMVVVTINYRLGPLGWFVLPQGLQDGDPLDDSGNYGTLDIIQALRWVRVNIAAFGGNPNNIVIAGESAGANDVCTLLISPEAKGLFHKAISESGGFFHDTHSMDAGRLSAQEAIVRMGCLDPDPTTLKACLMSKTAAEVCSVYPLKVVGGKPTLDPDVFFERFTDGAVISALGKDALKDPETYNQVPTILGTTKEEWKLFMLGLYHNPLTDDEYQDLALDISMQWQQAGVDDLARAMTANKGQPGVYAYEFDYGAYNETGYNAWPPPLNIRFGAWHSLEIPFIFGSWTAYPFGAVIFRADNQEGWEALSNSMVEYWSTFARTGHPFDPTGVLWRPWSNEDGGPKRILLDANATQTLIQMSDR